MQLNVIRTLKIKATTEGVEPATNSLNRLKDAHEGVATVSEKSARRTLSVQSALERQQRALDMNYRAQRQFEASQRDLNMARDQGLLSIERHNVLMGLAQQRMGGASAANDNFGKSAGLARHEMVNMSRQVQDIGVSLASGQSPFTVLVQQGTQVADIFASSQGSLRGFGSQVAAMFTPVRVLALGMVALGVAAAAALVSWKSFALQLDDTARQAGVTSSEMAKLQASASFKGISGADFADAMGKFSENVYLAKNNMGGLAEVFRANNTQATDFNSSIEKAADLIRGAATDQQRLQLLQQMGLPATMQWVRLLSQGSEGIRKAKDEAALFGGAANDNMVKKAREFDEAWNKAWTNFGLYSRNAVVNASQNFGGFEQFLKTLPGVGAIISGKQLFSAMTRPTPATPEQAIARRFPAADEFRPSPAPPVDPEILKRQLSLEQQRIGILGQLATVQDHVRQKEIEIQVARLSGVTVTEKDEAAILAYTRAQELGLIQMRMQTEAFKTEAATVGMSIGAATAYRAEQERLAEFRVRGITLTDAQAAALKREAAALGESAQAASLKRVQEKNKLGSDTMFFSDTDKQIAQQLVPIYGDIATAMKSGEAAAMRWNAAMSDMWKMGQAGVHTYAAAILEGKNGTEQLLAVTKQLSQSLLKSGIDNLLSGNPTQMLLGAAQAAGAFLVNLFNQAQREAERELKRLEDAQNARQQAAVLTAQLKGTSRSMASRLKAAPLVAANDDQKPDERAKPDDLDQFRSAA